jgi:hypothetical protein
MRYESERCEICEGRVAAVFMIVRQDVAAGQQKLADGRQRVAKAHVCVRCFELVQAWASVDVEEVSLQEWKEVGTESN